MGVCKAGGKLRRGRGKKLATAVLKWGGIWLPVALMFSRWLWLFEGNPPTLVAIWNSICVLLWGSRCWVSQRPSRVAVQSVWGCWCVQLPNPVCVTGGSKTKSCVWVNVYVWKVWLAFSWASEFLGRTWNYISRKLWWKRHWSGSEVRLPTSILLSMFLLGK